MKQISLILACTFDGGIGYENKIPWHIKSDLKKFKNITSNTINNLKQNAVIMGSKTYTSLPCNNLENRINIILSKNKNINNITYNNIDDALSYCINNDFIENIYIIGGAQIYNIFLTNYIHYIDNIYLTLLKDYYKCDTYILIKDIFSNFNFILHDDYNNEKDTYISYICEKKSKKYIT